MSLSSIKKEVYNLSLESFTKSCWIKLSLIVQYSLLLPSNETWHRGGGHIRLHRKVDQKRYSTQGIIVGVEYDPNRSGVLGEFFRLRDRFLGV